MYALVFISVAMFGGCFALNDVYRKRRGSSFKISMESAFIGALAGLFLLLIINQFKFEFTTFTLIISVITAINSILLTYFSFKALNYINLSLFSVFMMLGGMVLPFFQGIIFYNESITVAKIVCVAFICLALAFTVNRNSNGKNYLYYVGVFVLNGMSGVLSKLFNELQFEKTSVAGYSFWISVCTVVLSGILWIALIKKQEENEPKYNLTDCAISLTNGGLNRIANFLLVLALTTLDSSVQYPLVTGGVMIVSTLISFLSKQKPSKKEIISVTLAFLGTLALFVIPI